VRLPDIRLEIVRDLSPLDQQGFLRIVRRVYRAHYPDGTISAEFVYDEVDRTAIDAVVILAHFRPAAGERQVFLRSAVRPPVAGRDPARSPLPDPPNGVIWELPAGLIEPGEDPREAARRELEEELGFSVAPDALLPLGPSSFPAPGFIAERHFYFEVEVNPAARREPSLDGSALESFGVIVEVGLAEALELARSGVICDAKTELALRRLAERER
jgi:ADP-ribose pyrophosphatase